MRNLFLLLALTLFTLVSFAETRTDSDILNVGKKGSTADKILKLGDFRIKKGSGTKAEFSNDGGTTYKKIGSGSGSGGSGGINLLLNGEAEESTANWTLTGAGTFVVGNTAGERINGENYFTLDFSAASEKLESDLVAITKGISGNNCEAKLYYHGGDSSITMRVVDSLGNNLGEEISLDASIDGTFKSATFICPSQVEIGLHPERATIRIQLEAQNDSAPIIFDSVHLGTNGSVGEFKLPSYHSFKVLGAVNTGTGAIVETDSDYVVVTHGTSAGHWNIDYSALNLTSIPDLTASAESADANTVACRGETLTTAVCTNFNYNGGPVNLDFSTRIQFKDGDANKIELVYNSMPKVAQFENNFSAKIRVDETFFNENVPFIESASGAGIDTIILKAGVFSAPPNCTCSTDHQNDNCAISTTSTTTVVASITNYTGALSDQDYTLKCSRSTDHKTATVTPTVVGTGINVYTPAQADFKIDVSIGGANAVPGASSTPKGIGHGSLDMVLNKGSAKIACATGVASSGLTCSGADERIGLTFNAPRSGEYKICTSLMAYNGASIFAVRHAVTTDLSESVIQQGKSLGGNSASSDGATLRVCDIFSFSTSGEKTIRLLYESSGTVTFYADRLANAFERDINITVEMVGHNVSRPIIQNMVDTSVESGLRIESCKISDNGTALFNSVGCASWLSSVTSGSSGLTTLTLKENPSDNAVCQLSAHWDNHVVAFNNNDGFGVGDLTALIVARNSSSNGSSVPYSITCFFAR